jgi:hypothetical protein
VAVQFDRYDGSGHKFYFQDGVLAEITSPLDDSVVRIKKGQSITVTGVVGWYSPYYGYLFVTGAFLQR